MEEQQNNTELDSGKEEFVSADFEIPDNKVSDHVNEKTPKRKPRKSAKIITLALLAVVLLSVVVALLFSGAFPSEKSNMKYDDPVVKNEPKEKEEEKLPEVKITYKADANLLGLSEKYTPSGDFPLVLYRDKQKGYILSEWEMMYTYKDSSKDNFEIAGEYRGNSTSKVCSVNEENILDYIIIYDQDGSDYSYVLYNYKNNEARRVMLTDSQIGGDFKHCRIFAELNKLFGVSFYSDGDEDFFSFSAGRIIVGSGTSYWFRDDLFNYKTYYGALIAVDYDKGQLVLMDLADGSVRASRKINPEGYEWVFIEGIEDGAYLIYAEHATYLGISDMQLLSADLKPLVKEKFGNYLLLDTGDIRVSDTKDQTFSIYDQEGKLLYRSKKYEYVCILDTYFIAQDSTNTIKLYDYNEDEIVVLTKLNASESVVYGIAYNGNYGVIIYNKKTKKYFSHTYNIVTKKIIIEEEDEGDVFE